MKPSKIWLLWVGSLAINAYLAIALLASELYAPLWIVVLYLLVMESGPLFWVLKVIPRSKYMAQDTIGGFWFLAQIVLLLFMFASNWAREYSSSNAFALLVIQNSAAWILFLFFRIKHLAFLLNLRKD